MGIVEENPLEENEDNAGPVPFPKELADTCQVKPFFSYFLLSIQVRSCNVKFTWYSQRRRNCKWCGAVVCRSPFTSFGLGWGGRAL